MSDISTTLPAGGAFRPEAARRTRSRRPRAPARGVERARAELWESIAIFSLFFAAYSVAGYFITVKLQAIPFDATARLAHAYFIWHNAPAKLAAVGFVWPPLPTLTYLPFTLIKPIGSSLIALPLSTAFFAGLLLTTLNRTFTLVKMPWFGRYPLLLALAANPMFAHYAMNGMAEMVYLFLLVLSVFYFMKWYMVGESHYLALCGFAMGMALMSRYEVAAYAALVFAFVWLGLYRKRASKAEYEGSLLLYITPILYGIGLWVFFNWLIVGDPFYFLSEQVRQRFTETPKEAVSGTGELLRLTTELNFRLFAPALLIVPVLLVAAAVKRNLMSLMLAALIALNFVTTAVLIVQATQVSLLQPRFNMRSIPLVFVGVAWLFWMARGRLQRFLVVAITVLLTVGSYPLTWDLMKHFKYQFAEGFFVGAIETGKNQNPAEVGVDYAKRMGNYINAHVKRRNAILVDDAQSFLPMLMSGRPQLFLDRIDKGDKKWKRILEHPIGRVQYFLIAAPEASVDLILYRYKHAPEGGVPFLRREYTAGKFLLFRVIRPPGSRAPPPVTATAPAS